MFLGCAVFLGRQGYAEAQSGQLHLLSRVPFLLFTRHNGRLSSVFGRVTQGEKGFCWQERSAKIEGAPHAPTPKVTQRPY